MILKNHHRDNKNNLCFCIIITTFYYTSYFHQSFYRGFGVKLDCLDVQHIKMCLVEFRKTRFCNPFFCKALQWSGETQQRAMAGYFVAWKERGPRCPQQRYFPAPELFSPQKPGTLSSVCWPPAQQGGSLQHRFSEQSTEAVLGSLRHLGFTVQVTLPGKPPHISQLG